MKPMSSLHHCSLVKFCLIAGAISSLAVLSTGLRLTRFSVPSPVFEGESIICECEFDEGEDSLAALFWSLNGTRFYKYEPKGGPSMYKVLSEDNELFKASKIKVSGKSNGTILVLDHVSPSLSGELSCGLVLEMKGPNKLILYEKRWLDVRQGKRDRWMSASGLYGSSALIARGADKLIFALILTLLGGYKAAASSL